MQERDYIAMNRSGWDQRVAAHADSRFYDVDAFLAGASSLREIERAAMGEIAARRLLHLQCHFGLDTLSWARLGARCTGVDISPAAIELAKDLRERTGLDARFVCANLYDYRREPGEPPFDIVFSSYGAVCWMPDLERWARIVANNLVPGGRFLLVEFHPVYDLITGYSYFARSEPDIEESGTYTENGEDVKARLAVWSRPFSSVINALLGAGLVIDRLDEFPFSPYDCFKGLVEREPGRFFLQHQGQDVPLVYSLSAHRPG